MVIIELLTNDDSPRFIFSPVIAAFPNRVTKKPTKTPISAPIFRPVIIFAPKTTPQKLPVMAPKKSAVDY